MNDEEKERKFRELVKFLNSETLPCDDEGILAVHSALREDYGLDAYTAPIERKAAAKPRQPPTKRDRM